MADTHAHLQLLPDPALALARCAAHRVSFVCTIVDAFEDGTTTFDDLTIVGLRRRGRRAPARAHLLRRAFSVRATDSHSNRVPPAQRQALRRRVGGRAARAAGRSPRVRGGRDRAGLPLRLLAARRPKREAFRRQVRLAKECGLPVVLHVREAHDDGVLPHAGGRLSRGGDAAALLQPGLRPTLEPWVEAGCSRGLRRPAHVQEGRRGAGGGVEGAASTAC